MRYTLRSISFVLLFFTASILSAQILLVGARASMGGVQVVRWNANTGATLNAVPTTAIGYYMGASVFDAVGGQYYFRDPSGLQRISFAPDAADPITIQYDLSNAEIDMQNGKIYALSHAPVLDSTGAVIGQTFNFMQYRLADSTESLLLPIVDCSGYVSDASGYDSNHGIFYFFGVDTINQMCLYKVTTALGSYAYTKMPLSNPNFNVVSLNYDNDNDILYAIGHLATGPGNLQIQIVNQTTAAMTLEANFPQFPGIQGGSNTYDQASHSVVFRALDSTMALNTWGYDTQAHQLSMLQEPTLDVSEYEADNTAYAAVKYGTLGRADLSPSASGMAAYPNPASDRIVFQVAGHSLPAQVTVYDMRGALVASESWGMGPEHALQIQSWPEGIYIAEVLLGGKRLHSKFVVAH